MEKNVGGVDLEELMKARMELDKERGVETDPDMYKDYNKRGEDADSSISANETSVEVNQENNYIQETNDNFAVNNNADNMFAPESEVKPEQSAETYSNHSDNLEVDGGASSAFASKIDMENINDDTETQVPEEPKDLNMYDIFSQFEVAENANIKAPVPIQKVEPVSTPEPLNNNATSVKGEEDNQKQSSLGFDELVSELLADFNLDELGDEDDVLEEDLSSESSELESLLNMELENLKETTNQEQENIDVISEIENSSAKLNLIRDDLTENKVDEDDEIQKYINDTVSSSGLIGEEIAENVGGMNAISNSITTESKDYEVMPSIEKNDTMPLQNEENNEMFKSTQDVVDVVETNTPVLETTSSSLENSVQDDKNISQDTSESIGQAEVITDYSKLKDILQKELEEVEQIEVETLEETKTEIRQSQDYKSIEDFNFVEEIVNDEFKNSDTLSYLIGKDEKGNCVYGNFKEQYNLAVFGKDQAHTNTLINSILLSLSLKNSVSDVNFIILDADVNSSFEVYNKSSYIFFNRIAKTNKEIFDTLIEVSKEIDDRYNKLAGFGVKNIEQYNLQAQNISVPKMPYLVIVFNNYTKSSQATDNDKINACLHRVLKYGRIAGLYAVVVATNPIELDEINYNLPSRIALKNDDDSLYTIGEKGASNLPNDNDLLYSNIMSDKLEHLKLPNISETEKNLLIEGLEE